MKPHFFNGKVFSDERGFFYPLSLKGKLSEDVELSRPWVQSNVSCSSKYTFRGMHHQRGEKAQAKLVSVIKGSIIDFLIDLRHGSFMETYFFRMTPGDKLYVPRGFAHGFLALEEETIIQYLVDNDYSPESEISFHWTSSETVKELILAEVGQELVNKGGFILSEKDAEGKILTPEWAELIKYDN
jgi:dTDP-4-dehydrorhamnose 3,5-epimerase